MKVHGIPVVYDPKCRTVAQACGVWPFFRIMVGPHWYVLDGEARAALLLHEVAHCKMHHAVKRFFALPLVFLWALGEKCQELACAMTHRHELEADRFAAEHGFAPDLARALARLPCVESPFYPSHAARTAILLARHCKESSPC